MERDEAEIRARLLAAEAAFEEAGGRGVELAERIDALCDELARAMGRADGSAVLYPDDERLFAYRVVFASGMHYRFWAEDAAHASEQARDAEPHMAIDDICLDTAV